MILDSLPRPVPVSRLRMASLPRTKPRNLGSRPYSVRSGPDVKRLFRPKSLSRALAIFTTLACIGVAVMPLPQTARGAGAVSLIVVSPENSGHVAPAVVSQFAQSAYDGVVATGRYDV